MGTSHTTLSSRVFLNLPSWFSPFSPSPALSLRHWWQWCGSSRHHPSLNRFGCYLWRRASISSIGCPFTYSPVHLHLQRICLGQSKMSQPVAATVSSCSTWASPFGKLIWFIFVLNIVQFKNRWGRVKFRKNLCTKLHKNNKTTKAAKLSLMILIKVWKVPVRGEIEYLVD